MERLDKLLSSRGAGSRKEVQALIRSGAVSVNGETVRKPEIKIDIFKDEVRLGGQAVDLSEHVYIMMNKPAGVISATEDRNERTVLDLLPENMRRPKLFPAGRLDKDTVGLLIITDDGDFAHRMLSPGKHVEKQYRATLDREADAEDIAAFERGIILSDGTKCLPSKLEIPDPSRAENVLVRLCEGKYHQVKRMFASRGKKVVQLERISIGNLYLDGNLNRGEAKFLTKLDIYAIFIGNMH